MANYSTPTTLLEAVNACLFSIGESPVVTVDDSTALPVDVALALNTILLVNREVQTRGWQFNLEERYPLVRDVNGFIPIPSNALHVDPDGCYADQDGVVRGTRLYDRQNHTYVWTTDLTVTIKLLLDFESLPEAARSYITCRAVRRFQAGAVGSPTLNSFTEMDEKLALAQMLNEESDAGDFNVFTGTYEMFDSYLYRGSGDGPYS